MSVDSPEESFTFDAVDYANGYARQAEDAGDAAADGAGDAAAEGAGDVAAEGAGDAVAEGVGAFLLDNPELLIFFL